MTAKKATPPPADQSNQELLARIDAEQARLRELLSAGDAPRFPERPPSGKWSVVENVRHLLFAEQAHLGPFVDGAREWSALGYTPKSMLRARKLDTDTTAPGILEVLEAWAVLHGRIRVALANDDSERVRVALWKNLRHLQAHVVVIERLLRNASKRSANGLEK